MTVDFGQRDPLPLQRVHGNAPVKYVFQGPVGGRLGAGAVVRDTAVGHHHQVVGLQRHGDLVQHADHGAFGHVAAHHASQSAWCGGSRLASGSSISSTWALHRQRARQQHALALAARQLAERRLAPVPALGGAHGAVPRPRGRRPMAAPARPGAAGGRAWHTSHTVRSSARFRPGPARPARGRARGAATVQRLAQQLTLPPCGSTPRQGLEQRGLAGAVGARRCWSSAPAAPGRCHAAPRAPMPRLADGRSAGLHRDARALRPGAAAVHQPQQVAAAQHRGEHAHRQLLRGQQPARQRVGGHQQHAAHQAGEQHQVACVVLTTERTRCGAARPTKAISPVCATAVPVASASTATSARAWAPPAGPG
jgi:hypothetical protein